MPTSKTDFESPDTTEKIDFLRSAIEARLDVAPKPQPGDICIFIGRNGARYESGHLEHDHWCERSPGLSGCTRPMVPHVSPSKEGLSFDASGGYWLSVDPARLTHVGTREKSFWTWDGVPRARGGVYFTATVNVWQYEDAEKIY